MKMREYDKDYSLISSSNKKTFYSNLSSLMDNFKIVLEKRYSAEILQQQAKLESLQSRINPHFLYNTLDSIRGKAIEEGSRSTAYMIEKLAVFFRYTIGQSNNLVSIEQELRNVNNYMEILKYRFNNRFSLEITIKEDNDLIMRYPIPKLTLQPIVENAIAHGFDTLPLGEIGHIVINIEITQSRLIINIHDDGIGMDDSKLKKLNDGLQNTNYYIKDNDHSNYLNSGIALININIRIKLKYGERYGLVVFSTKNIGTEVIITLPFNKKEYEN
jgi:two-component system sensor histidine kinase YesM